MKKYITIVILLLMAFSCTDKSADIAELNDQQIREYLDENDMVATKTESGMYYIIHDEGSSEHPDIYKRILVQFKGYRLDGFIFDNSVDPGWSSFVLFGMMAGWQEAVVMLGKGGSGTFFFPSKLGFGSQNKTDIPPNSVLIYEITLVDFGDLE